MYTLFANALGDAVKNVMDNPTIGGVIGLVIFGFIVIWAVNGGKMPRSTPPTQKTDEQKKKGAVEVADQKEKDAIEAAIKAYKEAKK